MSRFGSDPLEFFNNVYAHTAPWEIDAPQPAMADLVKQFPPSGSLLDLGCAAGSLAIYLAELGHPVLGIDFVPTAIEQAQARLADLPDEVAKRLEFQVADAQHPAALGRRFGAIFDSGFYHLFDTEDCQRLVEQVSMALLPHGRYYLHEFAVEFPIPNVPRAIIIEELQAVFGDSKHWLIHSIQPTVFHSTVADPTPAVCACIEWLD